MSLLLLGKSMSLAVGSPVRLLAARTTRPTTTSPPTPPTTPPITAALLGLLAVPAALPVLLMAALGDVVDVKGPEPEPLRSIEIDTPAEFWRSK